MAAPVRPDPPESSWDLRVSDAERSRAVDLLRQQMTEGRLDLVEFEERTGSVMAARRRREVAPLFADLPVRWEPEDLHRRRHRRAAADRSVASCAATWRCGWR